MTVSALVLRSSACDSARSVWLTIGLLRLATVPTFIVLFVAGQWRFAAIAALAYFATTAVVALNPRRNKFTVAHLGDAHGGLSPLRRPDPGGDGASGVREPRRPRPASGGGAAAVPPPQ